jgi:peptidoglycan/LPS O-acetylase OafA/YrhL
MPQDNFINYKPSNGFKASSANHIIGIDYLRALAVLAVIIFHINADWLPGGFVGVDIFFVISGYVVAKSMCQYAGNSLQRLLIEFYKRRLSRILPALLLCVVITSIIFNTFIPNFYISQSVENTALASLFGFSNIVLANDAGGYFATSADFNPFTHTWSLGVEEQFYFLFPFLFFTWKVKNKVSFLLGLVFVSFICSIYLTIYLPQHGYYSIISRFWELGLGALLFIYHHTVSPSPYQQRLQKVFVSAGLILTVLGLVYSKGNAFPFPWALLAVSGTILLLHSSVVGHIPSQRRNNIVKSLIQHIGKLSYSLYLWHWPIFTFYRWTCGLETPMEIVTAIVITYSLAFLSYNYIELKINYKSVHTLFPKKQAIKVGIALMFGCYCSIWLFFNFQPFISLSVTTDKNVWGSGAQFQRSVDNKILSGRTIYVVGDSHAGAYSKMMAKLQQDTGIKPIIFSSAGCGLINLRAPILPEGNKCAERMLRWLAEIKTKIKPDDVLLLASLKVPILLKQEAIHPAEESELSSLINVDNSSQSRKEAFTESDQIIKELSQYTKNIIIDYPKPVLNFIPFRCSDWYTKFNPVCQAGSSVRLTFIKKLQQPSVELLTDLVNKNKNLLIWDPTLVLCINDECPAYMNTYPLYYDSNHLSGYGNEVLYPSFKLFLLDNIYNKFKVK